MNYKITKQGFTLIEIMIAIVVLSIGIIGLWNLQTRSHYTAAFQQRRNTAVELASNKLSELLISNPSVGSGFECWGPESDMSPSYELKQQCSANVTGLIRLQWSVSKPTFKFTGGPKQTGNGNGTLSVYKIDVLAGWGSNSKCYTDDINNCDHNVTLSTRFPRI